MLTARSLKRHLDLEVLVRAAPAPAWLAAALFALAHLLLGLPPALTGGLAALGALLAAGLRFRRGAWTEREALVLLDRAAGAGGLALSLAERDGPGWRPALEARLAAARPPPRALGRPLLQTLAALLFAGLSLLLPRAGEALPPLQAAAISHVEEARLEAAALAAEERLDAALAAELERLEAEAAAGSFDAADWAALDAVSEGLEGAAAQRAADLARAEAAAQALAEALDAQAGAEAEQRAREELESALAALGEEGERTASGQAAKPDEGGNRPGEQGAKGGVRTRAEARELAQALAARRQALERGAAASDRWAAGRGLGEGGEGRRSRGFVHDHRQATGEGGEGGPSAPTRGPGAAPVTFGPQHPIDPDDLQGRELPRGEGSEPTELEGIRRVAPRPGEAGPAGTLGAPVAGPDGLVPGAAPLAPRHRDLVRRYFDRPTGGKR